MSWNEPGNGQNNRDPWKQGKSPQGEPPDLDEILKKVKQKIGGLFGMKPSGHDTNSSSNNGSMGLFFLIIAGLLLLWILSGIFIVKAAEQAIVLRFGKYVETLNPGIHWIPRIVENAYRINTQEISEFPYQAEMLTRDENIVDVALVVQYRVGNPEDFLLKVDNPRQSLQEATASALRQVIGSQSLDAVLTSGRSEIREEVFKLLRELMAEYQTGLDVTDVTMQPAKPPEAVTAAFDDAIKAREDEQRFINKAQAYANRVEPIAQGQAQRILQQAKAYKSEVVLAAQGNIASYLAILPMYRRAPSVTRERLYLDAIESVLTNSSKVLVDVQGSNNMLYLPLDKLLEKNQASMVPRRFQHESNMANAQGRLSSAIEHGTSTAAKQTLTTDYPTTRAMRPLRMINPDSYVGTGGNS